MIKVDYQMLNDSYLSLKVNGHAQYENSGKDLICASVSSIIFGLMNAFDELTEDVEIRQSKNQIEIINHSKSETVQNYFQLALMQLKTIEFSYGEFIKVERKQ